MARIPVSFEFYPPKTDEQRVQLRRTVAKLKTHAPEFVSVTFGAGGSTLSYTPETVRELRQTHKLNGVPHVSCMGGTREEIRELLNLYKALGCTRIVALRGDLPSGMGEVGELRYASELVSFIRAEHGDWFNIEVAAYPEYHPQSRSPRADLENFVRKVQAGANSAITQYFYNGDAYFRFVADARKLGVDVPIVPGIMPITNFTQLMRFSEMCGAEVPKWIARRLESFGDDREAIRNFGLDVVTDLCRRLIDEGAPGLHFYTLNGGAATKSICERLGLDNA